MAVQVSKTYLLGEYRLEPDKRRLCRDGEAVRLTHRPFQVLLHLIEHRDRVVTRQELLDRFWDGKDVYDDTLRKCVGAIRKALGDPSENPRFIATHYAEGYRYIGPLEEEIVREPPAEFVVERTRGVRVVVEEEIQEDSLTQEGGKARGQGDSAASARLRPTPRQWPARLALGAGLAVLALIALGLAWYHRQAVPAEGQAAAIRSIAVLPFRNLTGDPAQDYFSDGVTESLISELAGVEGLRVISRTSAFVFKNQEVDAREVGRRLRVDAVLEGSVRRSGERVRVDARLVRAGDGQVIWANAAYDRPLRDILIAQNEIGCQVVAELRLTLCGEGAPPRNQPTTQDPEAYQAYLRGRYHWNKRSPNDLKQAIAHFEQAATIDPQYALAYAGLAETYTVMEVNAAVPPGTAAPLARANARKALELDDSLAGVYAALGLLESFANRNWREGERLFEQAIARRPGHATTRHWYALSLLARGRFAEAEAALKRAEELDPLAIAIAVSLGETYYYWRQYDRCVAQAHRLLELNPGDHGGYALLAKAYIGMGAYDKAQEVLPNLPDARAFQANIYATAGKAAEARRLVDELVNSATGQRSPYEAASLYATIGENELAFVWLKRAHEAQQADLVSLDIDPAFDALRDDPRFGDLVRRVGLAD